MSVDYLALAEFLSPLIVAIFAVWLGFRYQRVLADRESRKEAHLNAIRGLSEMMDAVDDEETISFSIWALAESRRVAQSDPTLSSELLAKATIQLVGLSDGYGVSPPWYILKQRGPEGFQTLVETYPPQLDAIAKRRFNEARIAVRDYELRILLSHPGSKASDASISAVRAMATLTMNLDQVIGALGEGGPKRVDWVSLNKLMGQAQTAAFRDLGASDESELEVRQYRHVVPWPKDAALIKPEPYSGYAPSDTLTHHGPAFRIGE